MSSTDCLRSEEPLQELVWGCSAGAVRQVYSKLPGAAAAAATTLTAFCSQGDILGIPGWHWAPEGKSRLARTLAHITERQLAQVDRVRGTRFSLWQAALSVFFLGIHLQSFALCYSSEPDHHML